MYVPLISLGGYEFLLIFLAILLLFGGRKIPELARGLGKGIREFNNARNAIETEIKEGMKQVESGSTTTSQKSSGDQNS